MDGWEEFCRKAQHNQTREVTGIAVGGEAEDNGGWSVWKGRQKPECG